MNKATLFAQAMSLPRDERVQLVMELWEIVVDEEAWKPSAEQLAEARRRLEEHRRDPSTAIPAEKVLERLRARFG